MLHERLRVFFRADAAQQDEFAGCTAHLRNLRGIPPERFDIFHLIRIDRHSGKMAQVVQADRFIRREQSAIAGNYISTMQLARRPAEMLCVSKFPAKVQSAQK